jgi:hypothetical protein
MADYVYHPLLEKIIASSTLSQLYQLRQKIGQAIGRKEAVQATAYTYRVAGKCQLPASIRMSSLEARNIQDSLC